MAKEPKIKKNYKKQLGLFIDMASEIEGDGKLSPEYKLIGSPVKMKQ